MGCQALPSRTSANIAQTQQTLETYLKVNNICDIICFRPKPSQVEPIVKTAALSLKELWGCRTLPSRSSANIAQTWAETL